jgi:hypothetical protein
VLVSHKREHFIELDSLVVLVSHANSPYRI